MNSEDSACVRDAAILHISSVGNELYEAAEKFNSFAVAYKLVPFRDGNQWCVLLGGDIQSGIAGFGDSPAKAIADFDRSMRAPVNDCLTTAKPAQAFTPYTDKELREWYPVICNTCGWCGLSRDCTGGGPIADTGDFNEITCPKCWNEGEGKAVSPREVVVLEPAQAVAEAEKIGSVCWPLVYAHSCLEYIRENHQSVYSECGDDEKFRAERESMLAAGQPAQAVAVPDDGSYLRPAVALFARRMEDVLRKNDHKGGWQGLDKVWLHGRLLEEARELETAIRYGGNRNTKHDHAILVANEAADVANFAMMIAENALLAASKGGVE